MTDALRSTDAVALRRLAEERLKSRSAEVPGPQSEAETQNLLHELQVHQIELEIQNQELHTCLAEIESAGKHAAESEERLGLAVAAADLGIFEHDHQTESLYWSPMMRAIFGWGAEKAINMPEFFALIHLEDRTRIASAVRRAHDPASDGTYRVEHRLVRPDGTIRWVIVRSQTFFADAAAGRRPLRTVGVVTDITERLRGETQIREDADRLRILSHKLLQAQEAERRRLARELHDEIGQVLCAISINLKIVKTKVEPSAWPRLEESIQVVDKATEQVRDLTLDLHPTVLDDFGLASALRWYVDRLSDRTGLRIHLQADSCVAALPFDVCITCFRVAQEALTNVVRHASAHEVWIDLVQRSTEIELTIRDDGKGFDVEAARLRASTGGSLGLLSMQERVELLDGKSHWQSEPGKGTIVQIQLPLVPATRAK
jgi:PAS domain S-box-containing protein